VLFTISANLIRGRGNSLPLLGVKMSLYRNINKRKRAGTSRPKSKSTISAKAYANMKAGFPKKKKKK
jgi:hypothetical protein